MKVDFTEIEISVDLFHRIQNTESIVCCLSMHAGINLVNFDYTLYRIYSLLFVYTHDFLVYVSWLPSIIITIICTLYYIQKLQGKNSDTKPPVCDCVQYIYLQYETNYNYNFHPVTSDNYGTSLPISECFKVGTNINLTFKVYTIFQTSIYIYIHDECPLGKLFCPS